MKAELHCTSCEWTYSVEVKPGMPVAALRADCPQCRNPVHFSRIIPNALELASASRAAVNPENGSSDHLSVAPPLTPEEMRQHLRACPSIENYGPWSSPRNSVLPGFSNRISPYLVCLRVAANGVLAAGGPVAFEEVRQSTISVGIELRKALFVVENRFQSRRGERVSAGFPVLYSEHKERHQTLSRSSRKGPRWTPLDRFEKSCERWANLYLGYHTSRDGRLKGGLFDMGLVAQVPGTLNLVITEFGIRFIQDLTLPGVENLLSEGELEDPHLINHDDAEAVCDYIQDYIPEEWAFISDVARHLENPIGGDELAERLAQQELDSETDRWISRDGRAWSLRFQEQKVPVHEELKKKVRPYLSGLLGRLHEMGLIVKISSERLLQYELSMEGRALLL